MKEVRVNTKEVAKYMIAPRRIVIFRCPGGYFIAGETNGVAKFFKYNAKDAAAADAYLLAILNAVRNCDEKARKWQRKIKPPRVPGWTPPADGADSEQ